MKEFAYFSKTGGDYFLMHKIIKFITLFSFLFVLVGSLTSSVSADAYTDCVSSIQSAGSTLAQAQESCKHLRTATDGKIFIKKPEGGVIANIPVLIGWAIQLLFVIAGLIAFVYLLLGGIKWITSGGDKGQVEEARNQIIHALIGLVVVFAAWGLIVLVEYLLGIGLGFSEPLALPDSTGLHDPDPFK